MCITEEKFESMLESHRKKISDSFKAEIEGLKKELKDTQTTLDITNRIATDNEKVIDMLKKDWVLLKIAMKS